MSRNKAKEKVKTAKGRKSGSTRWLKRQLNDPYVNKAQKDGYRGRAAYKLIEINEKIDILKSGQIVVDLGAGTASWVLELFLEADVGVIVAVIAGFGAIISEVGAVMMVGGNIAGKTRVVTTAIVLETGKGNFDLALALGIILLCIAFFINGTVLALQGRSGAL